jgi:nitroreductase
LNIPYFLFEGGDMSWIMNTLNRIKTAQWILLSAGLVSGFISFLLGVADNPPGIALLYLALACLAAAWVWNWTAPRDFWILLVISLAAFPVGVILHNLFYALGTQVSEILILAGLLSFLEGLFFLVAVVAVGPAALVALVGGIYTSWRGMIGLTKANRSIRKFRESHRITDKQLWKLVNLVRQSASGANLQPLKFILSNTNEKNQLIFPTLSWAGYLKDWNGPEEGERPSAYLILLGDTELAKSFQYDAGIASQSITLGAVEMGLGACLIGSIKRNVLRSALSIPEQYEILLVIALGKPAERVVIENLGLDGDIKYWRDGADIHHVPKRKVGELIL